ncbi:ganglioside GM2 activator-like [Pecten maximus]|uniref:ganglioside GM2 activator-like n=1 Tax=Pecten maximus TaxID=6579 RepID=UPI0014582B2F|nr:ganglioside GM2 activator-like [Pecten maximus]
MSRITEFLVICSLLVLVNAKPFTWSNCATTPNPAVVIDLIEVTPDPVELPGVLKLSVRGNTTRVINSAKLTISLHRDTFLLSVPIPCLLHLGSCEYTDLCSLLNTMETENWASITTGLATQMKTMLTSAGIRVDPGLCPLQVTSLNLHEYTINLPQIPSVLSWVASGDYSIKVTVDDTTTNENLLCLDLGVTLTKSSECTGWLCGRRKRDTLKN